MNMAKTRENFSLIYSILINEVIAMLCKSSKVECILFANSAIRERVVSFLSSHHGKEEAYLAIGQYKCIHISSKFQLSYQVTFLEGSVDHHAVDNKLLVDILRKPYTYYT